MFKIGLQIWSFEYVEETEKKRRYSVMKFNSPLKKKAAIELEDFNEFEMIPIKLTLTYIPDIGMVNYFRCPMKNCLYGTSRKFNFDRHVRTCTESTITECKQVKMEASDSRARESLAREGVLPSADYENFYYAVYDVESLMSPSKRPNAEGVFVHKLATVALVWNFGKEEEAFFYRRDMTPASLETLIEEFWEKLTELHKKMLNSLPQSINDGYTSYLKFVKSDEFKGLTPNQKAFVNAKIKVLRKIRQLRVYAWNSERYDSAVIIGPLVDLFSKDEKKFAQMSAIKRKAGYMSIQYDGISLLGNGFKISETLIKIENKNYFTFFIPKEIIKKNR